MSLSLTMPAIKSITHSITLHILSKLVFGRYAIVSIIKEANCHLIKQPIQIRKKIETYHFMCTTWEAMFTQNKVQQRYVCESLYHD